MNLSDQDKATARACGLALKPFITEGEQKAHQERKQLAMEHLASIQQIEPPSWKCKPGHQWRRGFDGWQQERA